MIIPGPLEMKNSTQNTPPWQFSELYHLCNNNLKNDLFASPLLRIGESSSEYYRHNE